MGMDKGKRIIIENINSLEKKDAFSFVSSLPEEDHRSRFKTLNENQWGWLYNNVNENRKPESNLATYDYPRTKFWKSRNLAKIYGQKNPVPGTPKTKMRPVTHEDLRHWKQEHLDEYILYLNNRIFARRGATLAKDLDIF